MPQKILLLALGVVLGVLTSAVSWASDRPDASTPVRPAVINHLAYFKLNDQEQIDALVADCDAMVAAIPGIVSYFSGVHLDTGRETVEGDYDVGFYVGFDTEDDYAAYVVHDAHVSLVEKWRPRLMWLRVHDIIDETP